MDQFSEVMIRAENKLRIEVKEKEKGRGRCDQNGWKDQEKVNSQIQPDQKGTKIWLVMQVIGAEEFKDFWGWGGLVIKAWQTLSMAIKT